MGEHKSKKQAPKKVIYITALLRCQRCARDWNVVDLNPERKVVPCPVCAEWNDIRGSITRGMTEREAA